MIVYFNGQYMDKNDVAVSPDDRGFLLADGLYEVIRSYRGHLFKLADHMARLDHGIKYLRLEGVDRGLLAAACTELIRKNQLENTDASVYIQVTRGAAKRSHGFPAPTPAPTVYAAAAPFDPARLIRNKARGIRAVTVPDQRWARCDLKTIGLTANVLANQTAIDQGADEAIFVRDGVLLEGSHSSFMAVCRDTVITAPLSNYILGGITRKFILELCRETGIPFKESPVFESDLPEVSEMMISGTTTEITPVVGLNGRTIGDGTPGPVTQRLIRAFEEAIPKPA